MEMAKFLINGGEKLKGEITVAGSKNTVLPCIAASILTAEDIILENVPAISDVLTMIDILKNLGARAHYDENGKILSISARELSSSTVLEQFSIKMRASFLLAGPLLGRMRKVELCYPGGDKLGARPLSTHFNAFRSLGAIILEDKKIHIDGSNLKGAVFTLDEPSVTATENIIMASCLTNGITEVHLAAIEPHIQELVKFLNLMGAKISWKDFGTLRIEGVKKMTRATFKINPDELEVSGFAALAAATGSELMIKGVDFKYLDAVILQLGKMGVRYKILDNDLFIETSNKKYQAFRIQSGLYPKLTSDHLPPFAVLATQAQGDSLIHEWLYEDRLKYIEELKKMGAQTKILDPHRAVITGPTGLHGAEMISYDVRAGLTVVIAALVSKGETKISDIEHIDRGYEHLEERLKKIGADISRIN